MFQHARQRSRNLTPVRQTVEPARAIDSVGKRTLTQDQNIGAPDRYTQVVVSARRELRAVRTVALPALIKTLRRTDLAALAKQIAVADATMKVRHMLMTANQHVVALEKAATFRDPMVLFLRRDLDTLARRAARVGAYLGAEDMMPRGHVEETKQPTARREGAQRVRKADKTSHRAEPAPSTGVIPASSRVRATTTTQAAGRVSRGPGAVHRSVYTRRHGA